jgi:hypothetical protein
MYLVILLIIVFLIATNKSYMTNAQYSVYETPIKYKNKRDYLVEIPDDESIAIFDHSTLNTNKYDITPAADKYGTYFNVLSKIDKDTPLDDINTKLFETTLYCDKKNNKDCHQKILNSYWDARKLHNQTVIEELLE